ncbi:IS3 family transposase [Erysipelothrix rhusiopathiae]|nr:IS3 family transposase [Erysipelothrix rhusiopathiae]
MNNFNSATADIVLGEHNRLNGVYGTMRLKYHIEQVHSVVLNHKLIRRYKNELNIKTKVRVRRPFFEKLRKEKSHRKMAPYLMNEDFTSTKPLEKLSTDVSYIQCSDGLLYLSAIKDLFNNEIIAYSLSTKNNIELLKDTMKRLPKASSDIAMINSDQGSLYYSGYYLDKLEKYGYIRSMSKPGHCWQNSPIENWFSQLKEECIRIDGKLTKQEAKTKIKGYVHWHNTERIQKDLGYLSPIKYKSTFYLVST